MKMSSSSRKQVFRPDYYCANKLGFVLEEVIVAEEKLGRHIKRLEEIYHLDKNIHNNDPDNIIVFKNKLAMDIYKTGGTLIQNKDGSYSAVKREKKFICEYCGKPYIPSNPYQHRRYCSTNCAHLAMRAADMPTKRELKEHLMEMDFEDVARLYGVIGPNVVNWCRAYDLPTKVSGLYKMRAEAKNKETQRMINKLKEENKKLAAKLNGENISEEYGGEDDWLE